MVGVEGIAEWIGRDVVDREGEKAGRLQDVYYDTTDHSAVFIAIKTGTFGRSHPVAPLTGATLSRDYVRLDASKDTIKDAPQDASGGRLTGVDAVAVLRHFALPVAGDLDGETRVCFQTAGAEEETERKRAEVAAEQARDAASDPGPSSVAVAPSPPERSPAAAVDRAGSSSSRPAPAPPAGAGSAQDDERDPLARLEELERRVSALEARR